MGRQSRLAWDNLSHPQGISFCRAASNFVTSSGPLTAQTYTIIHRCAAIQPAAKPYTVEMDDGFIWSSGLDFSPQSVWAASECQPAMASLADLEHQAGGRTRARSPRAQAGQPCQPSAHPASTSPAGTD